MEKGEASRSSVSLERGSRGKTFLCGRLGISGLLDDLQFKQVSEQDGLVAFTAAPAKSKGTAEDVFVGGMSLYSYVQFGSACVSHTLRVKAFPASIGVGFLGLQQDDLGLQADDLCQ
jgi:hypothetical protein